MSLSKYQLERTDITEIEQGRRVWIEQHREDHRKMRTMGDLLQGRVYAATEYWEGLRKRMTEFQGGGGSPSAPTALRTHRPPEPDPHPEHGVLCDCDDCDEAVKRLLRDVGVLPKGKQLDAADWDWSVSGGALAFRHITTGPRYRRDESDR